MRAYFDTILDFQDYVKTQYLPKTMPSLWHAEKKKNVIEHKYVVITKILACNVVHPQC